MVTGQRCVHRMTNRQRSLENPVSANTSSRSPRSQAVAQALKTAGASGEIIELTSPARTAAEAADLLGCDVGAIANSLVFMADNEPLLVLTSGRHRVDIDSLALQIGRTSIQRANSNQVRDATGQVIGGVAPVGHPEPLFTVVDEALADYPVVWAAGGTSHTIFPTSYEELLRITGGCSRVVSGD